MTPLEFITIAEETGLIVPLGQWVLEQACRQVVNWAVQDPRLARLCVAVNLSGRQLREPGLAASVANVLRRTGLNPARLCLESTESVLVEQADAKPPLPRSRNSVSAWP